MLTLRLPDFLSSALKRGGMLCVAALLGSLLAIKHVVPPAHAQAAKARKAIEKLENCSAEERKSGCIDILKVERRDGDKQAIKAQVRGGRIIWYEYDRKSGRVRRTN